MKIGIITCGLESNYGACLQACATLHAVRHLGYDAVLMNYSFQADKPYKVLSQPKLKSKISGLLFYKLKKSRWIVFDEFRKQYMDYTPYRLHTEEDFYKAKGNFDIFLVGSDQVWNPELGIDNKITLLSFYTGNSPRKISYASSFGVGELPKQYNDLYKSALYEFDSLSVREESGKNIIKSLTGIECNVVVDPVMLHTADEWNDLMDDSLTPKESYIFIYDMRHSKEVQDWALHLAKKFQCKVLAVSSVHLFRRGIKNLYNVSPSHYLSLIKNARVVVTDSFHGTVFSIIFNKEFYSFCSPAGKRIGGRLTNILQKTGLEQRLFTSFNPDINCSAINYQVVNAKVEELRKNSLEYLKTALSK